MRISRSRHINQKGHHEKFARQSQPTGKLVSYTVIHFVSIRAKFDICTVVGLNGHLLKIKCVHSWVNVTILASKSVPFGPTKVQVKNLALTDTKRITVYILNYSIMVHRKKRFASFPSPAGMSLPNSPWAGIMTL